MSTKTNTGGARLRHPPRKQVFSGGLLRREPSLCASGHSQSETQASANKWPTAANGVPTNHFTVQMRPTPLRHYDTTTATHPLVTGSSCNTPLKGADHETGMIGNNLEAKYPHKEERLCAQTTPPQPPTELAPQQTDHGEKKRLTLFRSGSMVQHPGVQRLVLDCFLERPDAGPRLWLAQLPLSRGHLCQERRHLGAGTEQNA